MLQYFIRYIVFVWKGKNDWHTLRVYAYFFENGEKNLRCQKFWIRVDMNEA